MATSNSNGSDPLTVALRLLTIRDHSEAELSSKLKKRGFTADQINAALSKCRSYNYLDDRRFAREKARALLGSGKSAGRKALFDLRRRGIPTELAEQALEQANQELDPEDILRSALHRRFPDFDYQTAAIKERKRVVNYFQRRGFPLNEIFNILRSDGD